MVMELAVLKARAQLNRAVLGAEGEQAARGRARAGASGSDRDEERVGAGGGGGGARAASRERSMAPAPQPSSPVSAAPWLTANATLAFNVSRFNLSYDSEYDLLSTNFTEEHDNHWFCAKWTNAQQDLFQVSCLFYFCDYLCPHIMHFPIYTVIM